MASPGTIRRCGVHGSIPCRGSMIPTHGSRGLSIVKVPASWHDHCITMRNSYHRTDAAFDPCYYHDWHAFGGTLENKAKPQETVARMVNVQSTIAPGASSTEAARRLAGDVWECKRNR